MKQPEVKTPFYCDVLGKRLLSRRRFYQNILAIEAKTLVRYLSRSDLNIRRASADSFQRPSGALGAYKRYPKRQKNRALMLQMAELDQEAQSNQL